MRHVRFALIILPMLLLLLVTSCSSEDDNMNEYEDSLVGTWMEKSVVDSKTEHYKFNSNLSGEFWTTTNGVIDNNKKISINWFATKTKLTITYNDGTTTYLYITDGGDLLNHLINFC